VIKEVPGALAQQDNMRSLYDTYDKLNECQTRHFDENEVIAILSEDRADVLREFLSQAEMDLYPTDFQKIKDLADKLINA
jgi:hypothetical protein